ncbi:unnamed protein product [Spirodela intermedia]|uniref:Uncharacterized protein n=1 Tax=Spirodela intermedia TaxID=51605 RepID=A0ABN7EBG8_SPIIN|nr:unnamed protein product [Spirodela intermedia]
MEIKVPRREDLDWGSASPAASAAGSGGAGEKDLSRRRIARRRRCPEIPEIKDKCRGLISRLGKPRRQSGDFRYDPLSYALNFDEARLRRRRRRDLPRRVPVPEFLVPSSPTPPHLIRRSPRPRRE